MKENLLLLAQRLEVPKAEALLQQARLWPNPLVTLDEVNLWATGHQLNVFGQELPAFSGGNFGKNQQLTFSVEQLIQTAGKRKKLIGLEEINVEKAKTYFDDVLRHLKIEFRQQLTNLQYLQFKKNIYLNQINTVHHLTVAYLKQVEAGNVPRGDYIRLKALELDLTRQYNELLKAITDAQNELKLLMHLPADAYIVLTPEGYVKNTQQISLLDLQTIIDSAKSNRPDLKISELELTFSKKLTDYEKSRRVPDLVVKGGYDRGGNFMYNFVGFGIALELPVFNRNQGNIRYAHVRSEQQDLYYKQHQLSVMQDITSAWQNLKRSVEFLRDIEEGYEQTLDNLLNAYTKNFINRNISMLEYLDFMEAYLENKKIILEADKAINDNAEELNFQVGIDIIK